MTASACKPAVIRYAADWGSLQPAEGLACLVPCSLPARAPFTEDTYIIAARPFLSHVQPWMHCRAAALVATALTAIARRIIFSQCGTFNPYPYVQSSPRVALCLVVYECSLLAHIMGLSLLLLVESRAQCIESACTRTSHAREREREREREEREREKD